MNEKKTDRDDMYVHSYILTLDLGHPHNYLKKEDSHTLGVACHLYLEIDIDR
jgi:hypothetical protein